MLAIFLVMRKRRAKKLEDDIPANTAELSGDAKPLSELPPPDDMGGGPWMSNKFKNPDGDMLSELASEPDIVELASDMHMQHRGPHELPSPMDEHSIVNGGLGHGGGFMSRSSAAPTPSLSISLDQALRESPSQGALYAGMGTQGGGDDTSTLAASTRGETRGEDISGLEQRQAQLAERKKRLLEIDEIEAEEKEIERRMARLRDGEGEKEEEDGDFKG